MSNIDQSISSLIELDEFIDIVDIGANPIDGLPPYKPLLEKNLARVIGFEPNEEALSQLEVLKGPNEEYLGKAVYDGHPQQLRICNSEGMSSLLEPNASVLKFLHGFHTWGEVKERKTIETVRLDDVEEITNIDYLKIDIQGGELEVFKNALTSLSQCCVIHTEVEFLQMYENQPLFSDVDLFLREQGFLFHQFRPLVSRVIKPLVLNKDVCAELSQATWADAVFIKDFTKFRELQPIKLKKIALILNDIYSSVDISMRALLAVDDALRTNYAKKYLKYLS